MPRETFKYNNGDLTVVWKPNMCMHSTICFKGLDAVFNPTKRPWINMEGAAREAIIEQVKKCPSGALSYIMSSDTTSTNATTETQNLLIEVLPDGPLLVKNGCSITLSNGSTELKEGSVALCRCGSSQNKPFCDGSHKKIGFKG